MEKARIPWQGTPNPTRTYLKSESERYNFAGLCLRTSVLGDATGRPRAVINSFNKQLFLCSERGPFENNKPSLCAFYSGGSGFPTCVPLATTFQKTAARLVPPALYVPVASPHSALRASLALLRRFLGKGAKHALQDTCAKTQVLNRSTALRVRATKNWGAKVEPALCCKVQLSP